MICVDGFQVRNKPGKAERGQNQYKQQVQFSCSIRAVVFRPAIPQAFSVRLQQLPSLMCDTRLRLLFYSQKTFALIPPTLCMLALGKIALT